MRRFAVLSTSLFVVAWSTAVVLAGPAELAGIKAGCQAATNWGENACQCLADRAAQLNEAQQGFLSATLRKKQAEATQFALTLSQPEIAEASLFVANNAVACQDG